MKPKTLSTVLLLSLCSGLPSLIKGEPLPVTQDGSRKTPVTLEIFCPTTPIKYRVPIALHVRFCNCGDTPIVLCLDNNPHFINTDCSIFWHGSDGLPIEVSYHNAKRTSFILSPHESMEVIQPSRLFLLGKHQVVAEYKDTQNGIPLLKSNTFEVIVENNQPTSIELTKIKEKTNVLIEWLTSSGYLNLNKTQNLRYRKYLQDEFLIYSPYCVPQLQTVLGNQDPRIVIVISEILGMIADKATAEKKGYIRDTSSAPFLLDLLKQRPEPEVRKAAVTILSLYYSDVLADKDKEFLKIISQAGTEEKNGDPSKVTQNDKDKLANEAKILWYGLPKSLTPLAKDLYGNKETKLHSLMQVDALLDYAEGLKQKPDLGIIFPSELMFNMRQEKDVEIKTRMMSLMSRMLTFIPKDIQANFEKYLLSGLEDPKPEIRFHASSLLIKVYPKHIPSVEIDMQRPDFCNEKDLKELQNILTKAKDKKEKP